MKKILLLLSSFTLPIPSLWARVYGPAWGDCGFGHGFGGFRFMMLPFIFIPLGILALIVVLIVKSVQKNKSVPGSRAMDILNERYARGEIDEETYKRMKAAFNQ